MIIQVCIPNTPFEHLDYLYPFQDAPLVGMRVKVPFRNKETIGIITGQTETSDCPVEKLRSILAIVDEEPIISEKQYLLYRWISRYYHVPLSDVLTQALPVKFRSGAPLNEDFNQNNLNNNIIDNNFEKKPLELPKSLNSEQSHAFNIILNALNTYHCFLLQGITGSGKTEVYLQAVQAVLSAGKQVLILVPEIGLTPQLLERFEKRFGSHSNEHSQQFPIVLMHSGLNDTERWRAWCQARTGEAKIIIGTRSAVFVPVPDLGLIVIDEEHDGSFKQQDSLRYSARDTAIVRAQMQQIPIILGSATPSLETLYNAKNKKYTLLRLTERAANAASPMIQLIDMRQQKAKHGLTTVLLEQIKKQLEKKEQVLIFVNRRGFAPVLLCHACGWLAKCEHCSARLTLHAKKQILQCHHCDAQKAVPKHCGECGKENLVPVGIGTERLETALQQHFPEANILRVDKDTTQRKNAFKEKLAEIHAGKVDILIGTQMLAKGHHFPNLTLVAMIDIDQGFFNQDFRAAEKIGQLILQVAGRAGREDKAGLVMIQTNVPDYPLLVMLLKHGYTPFSDHILTEREEAGFPPYGHIALFRCQSTKVDSARNFLEQIKQILLSLSDPSIMVLGPAPSPMEKKAGFYRMQLLVIAEQRAGLARAVHYVRQHKNIMNQRLRFSIDIDPVDLG